MKLYSKSGLTGQELSDYLNSINFNIPVKIPMPVKDYPAYMYPPRYGMYTDREAYKLAFQAYQDYMDNRANFMKAYLVKQGEYYKQFTDFAAYLETIFVQVPPTMTWLKIAERLIGKYGNPIPNPIYFISFKDF